MPDRMLQRARDCQQERTRREGGEDCPVTSHAYQHDEKDSPGSHNAP